MEPRAPVRGASTGSRRTWFATTTRAWRDGVTARYDAVVVGPGPGPAGRGGPHHGDRARGGGRAGAAVRASAWGCRRSARRSAGGSCTRRAQMHGKTSDDQPRRRGRLRRACRRRSSRRATTRSCVDARRLPGRAARHRGQRRRRDPGPARTASCRSTACSSTPSPCSRRAAARSPRTSCEADAPDEPTTYSGAAAARARRRAISSRPRWRRRSARSWTRRSRRCAPPALLAALPRQGRDRRRGGGRGDGDARARPRPSSPCPPASSSTPAAPAVTARDDQRLDHRRVGGRRLRDARVQARQPRPVVASSGSADVLEALGVDVNAPPVATVERCLEEVGIGFLFAPAFPRRPARHASGPPDGRLASARCSTCSGRSPTPPGRTGR